MSDQMVATGILTQNNCYPVSINVNVIVHAFLKQLLSFHFQRKSQIIWYKDVLHFKNIMHMKHKRMLFPRVDSKPKIVNPLKALINQLDLNRPNAISAVL